MVLPLGGSIWPCRIHDGLAREHLSLIHPKMLLFTPSFTIVYHLIHTFHMHNVKVGSVAYIHVVQLRKNVYNSLCPVLHYILVLFH